MADRLRVKGAYSGPMAKRAQVPISKKIVQKLGRCLVKIFEEESKKDFAKRGWSGEARDGSKPIWESFSYRISGERTIEIVSTFPDLALLTRGDLPEQDMVWLTQEAKDKHPADYPLTKTERERGMKLTGRVSHGDRLPLVVPLKKGSTVILRTAPLTFDKAWVHPGITRFTFMERAMKRGRQECAQMLGQAAVEWLAQSSR